MEIKRTKETFCRNKFSQSVSREFASQAFFYNTIEMKWAESIDVYHQSKTS
jgi:hypothetical protein